MRNLLLVAALLVQIFVLEYLDQIRGSMYQDVPLRAEENFDCSVSTQRLVNVLTENIRLVNVLEEGNKSYPERYRREVLRVSRRQEKKVVNESKEQNSEE